MKSGYLMMGQTVLDSDQSLKENAVLSGTTLSLVVRQKSQQPREDTGDSDLSVLSYQYGQGDITRFALGIGWGFKVG